MHWIYLCLAILFEVAGTISMKLSNGLTKPIPSASMIIFYLSSLSVLTLALKTIEISVAYAIWSGMGIVLITAFGFLYFQESISFVKIFAILPILIGVVTLNISGNAHGASGTKVEKSK
ncbi:DMT family transporter [Fictibacillus gelatini]|uniref:DMT family transporter n=1 Tax=Fictibacillus gelatini TaxID=225985 RepID=UPI000414347C|nr:multidrug efflux SMR transporter [Fictibacillus gelatini]